MSSSSPKENNFQIHFTQVSRWSHPRIYISLQCGCKWCKTCLVIPYNNSCEQNDDTIYGQLMWMRECSYHNIKGKQSRQKKELNQTYWPVWKTISTMSLSMENRNHSIFFLKENKNLHSMRSQRDITMFTWDVISQKFTIVFLSHWNETRWCQICSDRSTNFTFKISKERKFIVNMYQSYKIFST